MQQQASNDVVTGPTLTLPLLRPEAPATSTITTATTTSSASTSSATTSSSTVRLYYQLTDDNYLLGSVKWRRHTVALQPTVRYHCTATHNHLAPAASSRDHHYWQYYYQQYQYQQCHHQRQVPTSPADSQAVSHTASSHTVGATAANGPILLLRQYVSRHQHYYYRHQ